MSGAQYLPEGPFPLDCAHFPSMKPILYPGTLPWANFFHTVLPAVVENLLSLPTVGSSTSFEASQVDLEVSFSVALFSAEASRKFPGRSGSGFGGSLEVPFLF